MGYNTSFRGVLRFKNDPTTKQLAKLHTFFGEDCRSHPEWNAGQYASYIDLRLTKDLDGIEWNGAEKTYGLTDSVNVIVHGMRKEWPDFALDGTLIAQGDDFDDRWALVIGDDGMASEQPIVMSEHKVQCPKCHSTFVVESIY